MGRGVDKARVWLTLNDPCDPDCHAGDRERKDDAE